MGSDWIMSGDELEEFASMVDAAIDAVLSEMTGELFRFAIDHHHHPASSIDHFFDGLRELFHFAPGPDHPGRPSSTDDFFDECMMEDRD